MYSRGQLFLPFKELQGIAPYPERHNATIQFRIKKQVKDELSVLAKSRNLSITRLLNDIIGRYITGGNQKAKRQIGRGNVDARAFELVKTYLLAHPEGVRGIDIANFLSLALDEEVKHARAIRLIDLAERNGFLVTEDGAGKNIRYYAFARLS